MNYQTLIHEQRLELAREALREVERAHYRLSMRPDTPNAENEMAALEARQQDLLRKINELQTHITAQNPG